MEIRVGTEYTAPLNFYFRGLGDTGTVILSRVHMTRFAYVCKFCIYAKFAYVRKSGHVYAFTHVCKICTYAKVGKFAPASDQVQISFCVYNC